MPTADADAMLDIRHFILDWSGTMVDDLTPVWKTTNHVLATFGLPEVSRDGFRREFCLPVRKYYARLAPSVPMPELEQVFMAKYPEHHGEIVVLPHTREFLAYCASAEIDVYIASSVDELTYQRQMRRFDLDRYIRKPYIGVEDKTAKIHHILADNRLSARHTMFVGDMEHDIEAGKAGGVHTCAVLSGYNHEDTLRAMNPDLVCAHLGELREWITRPQPTVHG
jgi:phosphoglycolate phosphatase